MVPQGGPQALEDPWHSWAHAWSWGKDILCRLAWHRGALELQRRRAWLEGWSGDGFALHFHNQTVIPGSEHLNSTFNSTGT